MTGRGRLARGLATLSASLLLVAGTVWGEDDHFPFGPFRMYAVTTKPGAPVRSLRLEGTDEAGRDMRIRLADVTMRRAELQSQLNLYWADDAEVLPYLAEGYERLHGGAPKLVELRFVYVTHRLRRGALAGAPSKRVAAVWKRPR